jgi:hypothetical protein
LPDEKVASPVGTLRREASQFTGGRMYIGQPHRPLSQLEDLELRRDRLRELIDLNLVSPTLSEQIIKAIAQLESQILSMRTEPVRVAA